MSSVNSKYFVMSGVEKDMRVSSVRQKWGVECRDDNTECQCRPKSISVQMSVSDGKNGPVSGVGRTPFHGS